MTIEQKAREIAKAAYDPWDSDFQMRVDAAEAGIIEGVQMAVEMVEQYPSPLDDLPIAMAMRNVAKALRALIEEQKV